MRTAAGACALAALISVAHPAAQTGAVPSSVGRQEVTQVGTTTDSRTGKVSKVLDVRNVKGETNLSTDDRTMLRVYIAINYPDIEDCPDLTRLMEQIRAAIREGRFDEFRRDWLALPG